MRGKKKQRGFKVKHEYVPSKDSEERLMRAFEMIFFKDGKLAPEFSGLVNRETSKKERERSKGTMEQGKEVDKKKSDSPNLETIAERFAKLVLMQIEEKHKEKDVADRS